MQGFSGYAPKWGGVGVTTNGFWDCEMSGETVSVLFAPFCVRQMVFRRALQMIVVLYSVVFTLRCTGGISLLENLITQHKHMHEMCAYGSPQALS